MTHSLTDPDRTEPSSDPQFVAAFTAAVSFIRATPVYRAASEQTPNRPDWMPLPPTGNTTTTSADDDHWLPGVF